MQPSKASNVRGSMGPTSVKTNTQTQLTSIIALGLDGDQVDRDNFPLPNLASELAQCARIIHEQRGFFVLRGLEGSRYSVEDSTTIYLGIASYIADKRGLQDRKGNVLCKTHLSAHDADEYDP